MISREKQNFNSIITKLAKIKTFTFLTNIIKKTFPIKNNFNNLPIKITPLKNNPIYKIVSQENIILSVSKKNKKDLKIHSNTKNNDIS